MKKNLTNIKQSINYNNLENLKTFITNQNLIIPRSLSNVTQQEQRKISKAIKKARNTGMLNKIF